MEANPIRILVVDDDMVDRMAFLRHIEKEGLPYQCRAAASIVEAKFLLLREPFDAIILDYNLADGPGFDLLPHVGGTPVIVVTGSESPEHAVEALKSGANDYLLKDQNRNYLKLMPLAVERAIQQRLAREQLAESQELFRQAFNEGPTGKAFIDPDGRFLRVNRGLCEIFGVTEAEFLERGFQLVFNTPQKPDCMGKLFPASTGPARTQRMERCCRNQAGEEIWIQLDVALVLDSRGKALTYVSHLEDITAQHRAEETQARLEGRLNQAQKMEALGTLAGGVAHEFNNMLGVIIGYTELSRMELAEAHPALPNLDQILKASQRAKEIIQQILTFSRRQELKRELIHVQPMVEEAVKLIRPTVPDNVEIVMQVNPICPPIFGNATQISQVLMNLCTNAWQAMAGQGGRVAISQDAVLLRGSDASSARLSLAEGQYVLLSITDNGQGMDEATLRRVFEPFFTTKAPGHGSGLGMAVVHGIMKAHDGAVTVQSELGKGTAVHLYFPVSATGSNQRPVKDKPSLPAGRGQRILLVDDELPLVHIGTRILRGLGYEVTGYTDPKEAIDALRQRVDEFDLVITDLNMPLISGVDLAVSCLQLRPGIPVILASGFIEEAIREEARSLGIRETLAKPFTAQTLAEVVHRVLAKPA